MHLKKIIYTLLLISSTAIIAQVENDSIKIQNTPKLSVLDSIKKTFVKHDELSCIDNEWMKELANQELSYEQFEDISKINIDETVAYDLSTDLLKERLKALDSKSPFNIEYNPGLENMIKSLLKNRKKSYERLLAISQYYFPMFEDALAKYNIPIEVKYLAIVESALNPKAKSRVGATGLWQFMYGTGIQYNLDVNSYVDERSDPIKATEAACKYLSGMYSIFGDWDLVLASYNCGPGNVTKAIRRSGGQKNYWNIRKNLPKETAGYVPAFLATLYIFEYHKEHGINPQKAPVNYFTTDTIMVKHELSFKQISKLLDIPVLELQFLNPAYKLDVIPFVPNKNNYLRLPQEKVAIFTSNEDKIYYYAQYESNLREKPNEKFATRDSLNNENAFRMVTRIKYYKVRKGDDLADIASKNGVSQSEIKKWNKIKGSKLVFGKKLKIITSERVAIRVKKHDNPTKKGVPIPSDKQESIATTNQLENNKDLVNNDGKGVPTMTNKPTKISLDKKEAVATVDVPKTKEIEVVKEEKVISYKEVTKLYKVKKGDNLGAIASKYNVSATEIKKWNKLKNDKIAQGKNLKIVATEKIVSTIKKKIKKAVIEKQEAVVSNKIKNKNSEKIDTTAKPLANTILQAYVVEKGDNLNSISKRFNVTMEQLKDWNNLENNNVMLGSKLIVSKPESDEKKELKTNEYIVAKGDNVWNISQKFGVTLAQLKEWNDLPDNSVQIGTKLIVFKPENSITSTDKNNFHKKNTPEVKNNEILYYVKKGDSLFSISKKYPGVTVSDLKKWNDIEDGNIKPGMKLKIGG